MEIEIFGRIFEFLTDPEQWQKLINFINVYFINKPITIIALIAILIAVVIVIRCRFGKAHNMQIEKTIALLCYIVCILILSIFNRDTGKERVLRLYFDPWLAGDTAFHESTVLLSLLNCFYFIPYGLLIKWQSGKKKQILSSLSLVIITAFIVELLQYVLIKGVASITDFIFYCIGGFLGVLIMTILQRKAYTGIQHEQ